MKYLSNLLICVLLVLMSGCYKMRNRIETTTEIRRIPIETSTRERVVKDKSHITLVPSFEHDSLVVRATQNDTCVDDTITKYSRTDYVHKKLPSRYRAFLSTGIAFTGAGALLTSLGAVGMTRDYPSELGNSEQEKENDELTVYASSGMVVGSVMGSIGIMMLISSLVDGAAARDEVVERAT